MRQLQLCKAGANILAEKSPAVMTHNGGAFAVLVSPTFRFTS
jgi:hypothetical protein